jgi:phosphatidylglycerol lysyltransferase
MEPSEKFMNESMKRPAKAITVNRFFSHKAFVLIRENRKLIIQFLFTVLFVYTAFWFISHERSEIGSVRGIIKSADANWVMAGIALVLLYILLRGLMYVTSFACINKNVSLRESTILFLKRNFISVFLPAGGVSSLIFFTSKLEKQGITKSQIFFASSVSAFVSILTVVIVAVPAFLFVVSGESLGRWLALGGTVLILVLFVLGFYSLKRKTGIYRLIIKILPGSAIIMEDMSSHRIKAMPFIYTIILSIIVELIGIAHVYIAMIALGSAPSLPSAIMSYLIVVLFIIISPFLRGLGAIEVSMSYILIQFGFGKAESIAITMLFRFFEFWLPLLAGMLSFLLKAEKLFLRILPALLIFSLGIVNIISVLTPALPDRINILRDFLFMDIISFSNIFVLVSGLLLLLTSTFMLRGLRTSWWFALILSFVSMIGHMTKGIDYEEASVALFVIFSLLATRKEYYVRANKKLGKVGLQAALLSIATVILFGIIGFYFLDQKHFRIDFSILQSIRYTILNFFLLGSRDLVPYDQFARDFINLIKISGLSTISFLVYTLARPYFYRDVPAEEEKARAVSLVEKCGRSSLDYFKTYPDKLIYAPEGINAFISYKVSRSFAVVLEDPVSEDDESMRKCILSFSSFCYDNGLKDIYYRVPKESLHIYRSLSRKSLFIGQEAIVDLSTFSLSGGEMKPLRNALNKIKAEGYLTQINTPPLRDGLIQKLKAVSSEWLDSTGRNEIAFSQGVFDEKELKGQVVITVENHEEEVIAFLNIIPDHMKDEGTYDLQRKSAKAPNGVMDHLIIELFNYMKASGIRYVNLGFAPMSGVNDPHNFPERSMKFAYEKIRSFSAYKGLREYKDKFKPIWNDKYLIYGNDYDLVQIPRAIAGVIKP